MFTATLYKGRLLTIRLLDLQARAPEGMFHRVARGMLDGARGEGEQTCVKCCVRSVLPFTIFYRTLFNVFTPF